MKITSERNEAGTFVHVADGAALQSFRLGPDGDMAQRIGTDGEWRGLPAVALPPSILGAFIAEEARG